jgi:hypothetical protein
MKTMIFLFAAVSVLAGCGAAKPAEGLAGGAKAARERLLAQGFKPDPAGSYMVILSNVRLSDAARILSLSPAALKPVLSQPPDSDVRTASLGDMYVLVYSEVRDNEGRVVPGSLDDPQAICTVRVGFLPLNREGN